MQFAVPRDTRSARPEFATILQRDKNVVNIPRVLDPSLKTGLQAFAQRLDFRTKSQLDTYKPDLSSLLRFVPKGPERSFLESDIRYLAQQAGALLKRKHVQSELFIQRSDGCSKIHADNVTLRLICTYAGPGTEWLTEQDLVRQHLGPSELDPEMANRRVIREGGRLRRSSAGDILILKGAAHPGNEDRGAAHRSPPLRSSGIARLVLKIDEHPCGC